MARYSVATTKDNLSTLIDKALAGEEVVITRRGKPTVRLVPDVPQAPKKDARAATERLRTLRESGPTVEIPLHRFYEWLYEDEE
jgi:prevent-host-death family protein